MSGEFQYGILEIDGKQHVVSPEIRELILGLVEMQELLIDYIEELRDDSPAPGTPTDINTRKRMN